jgi:hypothetical protein
MAPGLRIAPLRDRLLAGLVDACVFLPLIGLAIWAGYRLWRRFGKTPWAGADDEGGREAKLQRWRWAITAAGAGAQVLQRNRRSPGDRLLGIRVADVRTGAPVSVRSVLVGQAVSTAESWLIRRAVRPLKQRSDARMKPVNEAVREIRRRHGDDEEAAAQAIKDYYEANDINALSSCLPHVAAGLAPSLPIFLSPRRQTLADWAAGRVMVVEKRR